MMPRVQRARASAWGARMGRMDNDSSGARLVYREKGGGGGTT